MAPGIPDGLYRINFTNEQLLTALEPAPGAPLVLLPRGNGDTQEWRVRSDGNGLHTITAANAHLDLTVSYDGEPDMHEPALLLPDRRSWNLLPGNDPDTYLIGVPNAPMRLGMSLLRIFPPRVALAPEYGDPYQAWIFEKVG
ncbi:RICIN domain-containing protein [Streptomyces sp. NL15-2K]|uniref:RICIN domain-containing protein n=1 Tax=Streptomyces sp. NL15-2K TaxID=376149 RepID=UPI000F57A81C|nr:MULTISPECIES: RICIN domain-containing protein [Actinomycetes]WKX10323.1 RICIN domain-containing protein [Kutzneria buriramensis]GCB48178.1 hypothetical protein SNL152K_5502 [Streptomyces sp. NL15-2K]